MMFPIILLNAFKLNFLNSYFINFPYPRSSFQLLSGFSLLIYILIVNYKLNHLQFFHKSRLEPERLARKLDLCRKACNSDHVLLF